MGPYSHYVIANYLESHLKPENISEYYWGSVAPDVRYLIPGMNRQKTHLPPRIIQGNFDRYPDLKDFLKGYLVHCICDRVNILQIVQGKFPYNVHKNNLTRREGSVILEFFNILRVKTPKKPFSGNGNAFLRTLGVDDTPAVRFGEDVSRYVSDPTLRSTVALYQSLGFARKDALKKYRDAAMAFQRNWFQKNLVLFGLQVGKVNTEISADVRAIYNKIQG